MYTKILCTSLYTYLKTLRFYVLIIIANSIVISTHVI